MFNAREIIHKNGSTFYDFDTQKRRSQKPRAAVICIVAIVATLILSDISDNLLAGFLAVQSILLGFTFNMMFFLLNNRERGGTTASSIEDKLRAKRLRDLYHELFYNVSYFNLVAVVSIVVALLLLLPKPTPPGFLRDFSFVQTFVHWVGTSNLLVTGSAIFRGGKVFAFYAISIEVIFSIARMVGRTSFYFERKMDETRRVDKQDHG